MPLTKLEDCKNTAPAYDFRPVYYACFAGKKLPNSFKAKLGPTTTTGIVDCTSLGWPATQIDIVLTRTGPCDYVWAWSNGSIGVILSTGVVAPLMCQTPNMPDITAATSNGTFWYVQDGQDLSGSCFWNPETNETTFTLTGKIVSDPGCETPITITYTGV